MSALTQRTCTIYTFIHQIYANHNLGAQAVAVVQNGTLGRIYKSAPTAYETLFQQPSMDALDSHDLTTML